LIIPPDASVNVQRALQEIDERLKALEQTDSPDHAEAIRKLQTDVARAARKIPFDEADAFTGSGSGHAFGLVPTPGAFSGSKRFLAEDGTWEPVLDGVLEAITPGTAGTSTDQAVLSLKGSLAVTSGLQADSLFARTAYFGTPSCRVTNSANISITDNTLTALTFDTERWDTDGMHTLTGSTGRITVATGGKYLIGAHISWADNATGRRQLALRKNGSTVTAATEQAIVATSTFQSIATLDLLGPGDYYEVRVFQNSGGPLNVSALTALSPEFWMQWVSM
jgi:hypothetical protein